MDTTVRDVAKVISDNLTNLPILIGVFCYVAGLCLTVFGLIKLKEHSDTKGQVKLSLAVVYVVAGTLLISITTLTSIGKQILGLDKVEDQASGSYEF